MPQPARRAAAISRAACSAIIAVGVLVLPEVMVGITEASTTRRPVDARTSAAARRPRPSGSLAVPIFAVPTGWKIVVPISPAALASEASSSPTAGPGRYSSRTIALQRAAAPSAAAWRGWRRRRPGGPRRSTDSSARSSAAASGSAERIRHGAARGRPQIAGADRDRRESGAADRRTCRATAAARGTGCWRARGAASERVKMPSCDGAMVSGPRRRKRIVQPHQAAPEQRVIGLVQRAHAARPCRSRAAADGPAGCAPTPGRSSTTCDAERRQPVGRTDAGAAAGSAVEPIEPAAQDHFAPGAGLDHLAVLQEAHADRAAVLDDQRGRPARPVSSRRLARFSTGFRKPRAADQRQPRFWLTWK